MSCQPQYKKAIVEALSPEEIARQVEEVGVAKARAGTVSTLGLAVMAGAFIGLGGVLAGTIAVGSELGAGPTRLLMGLGLTMALFMVVITGSELFTGNNMMLMGLFTRRITLRALGRNWALVYVGNLAGALIVVLMVYYGQWWAQGDFSFAGPAVATANAKVNLSFGTAFVRGILANILVCMAIWLATAGRTTIEKLVGIILPVSTFIAAGFEHSVANMYFVPLGVLLSAEPEALTAAGLTADTAARLDIPWTVHNLAAASLGNIVGGGVLIGLAHWFIHLRGQPTRDDSQGTDGQG